MNIRGTSASAWAPSVLISERAAHSQEVKDFVDKIHFAYLSPDIDYTSLGSSVVTGCAFSIKSRDHGVVADSLYLLHGMNFEDTLNLDAKISRYESSDEALVIGNVAWTNYYHWTLQCLASLLMYRELNPDKDFITVMPELNGWRRETLSHIDFGGAMVEVTPYDIVHFQNAVRSNLSGGQFAWTPHRAVLSQFAGIGQEVAETGVGSRIYVSRLDAGDTRAIINEQAVCEMMESYGFKVVTPGRLSVAEQISAFRNAEVIVGPHGAGMTNLVYCRDGAETQIVELFQSSCVNACYARICQAKGFRYAGLINPDAVMHGPDGSPKQVRNANDIGSEIDLALLESVVSRL